ncbi:hypothetical protein StoSoilB5_24310 [Arthrobacter sp. StoSoilB5]|nr:hypothetical protein StoSoilB5_24310 [Arthrobacter sp. StoSoilB5]
MTQLREKECGTHARRTAEKYEREQRERQRCRQREDDYHRDTTDPADQQGAEVVARPVRGGRNYQGRDEAAKVVRAECQPDLCWGGLVECH